MKKKLIERIEQKINETPTGNLRELLTDINILLQSSTVIQHDRLDVLSFKIINKFNSKNPLQGIADFDSELINFIKSFK